MAMLEKLREFLDGEGANYDVHAHPAAYTALGVARAEHLPADDLAKVIVIHDDGGYRMLVVPASRRIDIRDLRDTIGTHGVRLASEEELASLFAGCEVGAMPPFGNLWGMPVWVDDTLSDYDEIVFNAGNHRETVHMRYDDFDCLVRPQYASFSRTE